MKNFSTQLEIKSVLTDEVLKTFSAAFVAVSQSTTNPLVKPMSNWGLYKQRNKISSTYVMSFLFIQMGKNTNSESMLFYMKQDQASETGKKNNPNSWQCNIWI